MSSKSFRSAICGVSLLVCGAFTSSAAVVISEIDYDMVGTDSAEFVELYNDGSSSVNIGGYVLVMFNGSSGAGASYGSVTIPVDTMLAAGGYYVIGAVSGANQALHASTDALQNGAPDAIALYTSGSFPNNTAATANNGSLVYGIIYEGTEDTDYPGFLATVAADSNTAAGSIGLDSTGAWAFLGAATPGVVNVPEPASVLLGAIGLLGILRRRR